MILDARSCYLKITARRNAEFALKHNDKKRRELVTGGGMAGYECTISVADVKATGAAIEAAGGKIFFPPFHIEGVGTVSQFEDTEGNRASAMQYVEGEG